MTEIVASLPEEIFFDLNGGVLLKEEVKLSPHRIDDDLYILGEYHFDRVYGRYIVIYFGSMQRVYGHLSEEKYIKKLEDVVKHELTHHLEHRARERDLEKEDERRLIHYYEQHARHRGSRG
ncbi:MAG: hypothetical protein GX834_06925 [Clostridiaceae bacterium]|nr:hypothetical protein [Clostridiaceae bacterium]